MSTEPWISKPKKLRGKCAGCGKPAKLPIHHYCGERLQALKKKGLVPKVTDLF